MDQGGVPDANTALIPFIWENLYMYVPIVIYVFSVFFRIGGDSLLETKN